MDKIYAFADLPRTGLCNMLNVWARAFLWSKDNNVKLIAPNWVKIARLGPWLRGERDKRYYCGQITNKGYVQGIEKFLALSMKIKIDEGVEINESTRGVVRFSGQKNNILDFYNRGYELHSELRRIAFRGIIENVNKLPKEYIGVHIRRGDFRSIGLTLPDDYYLRAISIATKNIGSVPVLVFSDAAPKELSFLKESRTIGDRVHIMGSAPALQDVLSLSRSSALVGTNGSSFSEWAAFLGAMPTYWSEKACPVDDRKCGTYIMRV